LRTELDGTKTDDATPFARTIKAATASEREGKTLKLFRMGRRPLTKEKKKQELSLEEVHQKGMGLGSKQALLTSGLTSNDEKDAKSGRSGFPVKKKGTERKKERHLKGAR